MAYVQGLCSFTRWVVPLIYQILVSTKNGLCSGSMFIYQMGSPINLPNISVH